MQIKLYRVTDEPNIIPKHLENEIILSGVLRSECIVENPVFTIESDIATQYNYAYIPDFKRYYYLSPPVSIRKNLVEYSGNVDVLQSFYNQFKYCPMIASRSDSTYNPYIVDSKRKFEQRQQHEYIHIGAFENAYSIVMVAVG